MEYSLPGLRNIDYENPVACSSGRGAQRADARRGFVFMGVIASALALGCRGGGEEGASAGGAERDIRAVLARQVQSWNAGDLAGFMDGYEKSDRLRFHSGGDVTLGWQTVAQRYRTRYQDRAAMGTLTFSELAVDVVAPETALAFGRWRLQRAQDQPSGLFTLMLRRRPEGWRIVYDHTSAAK
jgi:ketosteroid isomerase-like protein